MEFVFYCKIKGKGGGVNEERGKGKEKRKNYEKKYTLVSFSYEVHQTRTEPSEVMCRYEKPYHSCESNSQSNCRRVFTDNMKQ
jgi:hypothetical protein